MGKKIPHMSIDKERLTQAKRALKNIGMELWFPKLSSNSFFWEIMSDSALTSELVRDHPEIPPHTLKAISEDYRHYQRVPVIPIINPILGVYPASIKEYRDVLFKLPTAITRSLSEDSVIRAELDGFVVQRHVTMQTYTYLNELVLKYITLKHSSLDGIGRFIHTTDMDAKCRDGQISRSRIFIGLHTFPTRHCVVNGKSRPVRKVQYIGLSRKAKEEVSVRHKGAMVPLYIQSHALHRIAERFDICMPVLAQETVFKAVENSETVEYRGNILIPVNHKDQRIGYLVCSEQDEFLLITTFLLVVHIGTPEGDLFMKETNLEKDTMKFLQIDRLSQFFESNLKNNPVAMDVLSNCNLAYMTELKIEKLVLPEEVSDNLMTVFFWDLLTDKPNARSMSSAEFKQMREKFDAMLVRETQALVVGDE